MKTKLLKKLRKKACKTWTVVTDSFGQAWIYNGNEAVLNMVCHKRATKVVDDLRRYTIAREVTLFRFRRKRGQKVRIY